MKEYLIHNNTKAVLAITRDWSVIFLVAWLNIRYPSIYLYLPSVWLIGAFQFAIGESLLHEASHHNLFRQKRLNYYLEFLYALPFFKTVEQFRHEHLVHHSRLGKMEDHLVEDYRKMGLFNPRYHFAYIWFIKPLIGLPGIHYIRTISLRPFKSGWKIIAFWAVVVALFAISGKLLWLVKFWLFPLYWSGAAYLYWSEISDHFHTVSGTRTNINAFTNMVTHNNGYHYIHHKYPTIPWFRLPEAYVKLAPIQSDITTGFFETYRQIVRNKSAHIPNYFSENLQVSEG
ncbi:fatty acid desaturase [Chitinophaga sp. Cy-1792]|uniref:fatty acid desaturase family protein n=1 Tax=Chitinophaga sp. Cy-1792 TaxID=2608339 RepID=UPI0014203014|nr:fatty acid desaturase [Chitinophaga sp. Cy-1792]NIG54375.1 fatty acid desaturase [Chitinophaga sp. Cy-1792]